MQAILLTTRILPTSPTANDIFLSKNCLSICLENMRRAFALCLHMSNLESIMLPGSKAPFSLLYHIYKYKESPAPFAGIKRVCATSAQKVGFNMLFKIISSETLSKYLQKKRSLLIDLRDKESYQRSHIPGAVWMDWEQAEKNIAVLTDDFHANHGFYPDWIILYCDSGNISLLTARDLAKLGYPIMSLNGGFQRWDGRVIA